MLIYRDIFSGDELCSDSFPVKVENEVILEFTCKYVVRKEGDIKLAGANASEEEQQDDGTDETVERGIDVVLNHRLQEMTNVYGSAKAFKEFAREYMKKLSDKLKENGMAEEDLKKFKSKMQEFVVSLLKKERFKNLQFFCGDGESAIEGQLGILEYREIDGVEVPVMMFIRAGMIEEKF